MKVDVVLSFVAYFLLDALVIQVMHMLTGNKLNNKSIIVFFLILNSCITAIALNEDQLDAMSYFIKNIVFIYYIFSRLVLYAISFKKINKQIIWLFLVTSATNQIYSNITKQITTSSYRVIIAYILESLIIAFAIIYIKWKKKEEVYRQIISSLPKKLYVLVLVMLIIAAVFVMAATRDDTEDIIQYVLLPSMIGLVLSTVAVVKIGISEAEKKANVDILSKQVESQIGYYEKINKIYGEFRSFRHDYKNHVLCLRGLIAADKKEEALEYMKTMQDMSSVGKNKYHTGNVIIDALLDDKSEKAEKVNTKLVFEGIVPTSGISNADLCVIMANAIDNAIEACSKDESGKEKEIKAKADFKQGYFFFRASNPMFEEVKFKEKNKVATSKSDKEHHGFGVANIVHTAEKYGGSAEISTDNGMFTIDVQLLLEQA